MAFVATKSSSEPRSVSVGPYKIQIYTFTAVSGDTSGTITADGFTRVFNVITGGGLNLSSAPTFSSNVVTLAFTDPAANAFGTALVMGI